MAEWEEPTYVGVAEIAALVGMGKSAVSNWPVRHKTFPAPIAVLTMGPIYLWPEIKEWLKSTGKYSELEYEI